MPRLKDKGITQFTFTVTNVFSKHEVIRHYPKTIAQMFLIARDVENDLLARDRLNRLNGENKVAIAERIGVICQKSNHIQ